MNVNTDKELLQYQGPFTAKYCYMYKMLHHVDVDPFQLLQQGDFHSRRLSYLFTGESLNEIVHVG